MDKDFENGVPDGISVSEQSLESPIWRLQLDLADGGIRSWLLRPFNRFELVDRNDGLHPFQVCLPGATDSAVYRKSRACFDPLGASLIVETELADRVIQMAFRVESGSPRLFVSMEFDRPGDLEISLRLISGNECCWKSVSSNSMVWNHPDFQLLTVGRGITFQPHRQIAAVEAHPALLSFRFLAKTADAAVEAANEMPLRMHRSGNRR